MHRVSFRPVPVTALVRRLLRRQKPPGSPRGSVAGCAQPQTGKPEVLKPAEAKAVSARHCSGGFTECLRWEPRPETTPKGPWVCTLPFARFRRLLL